VEPADWSVEGRGNLESWHNVGYIAYDHVDMIGHGQHSRTVSRTVEYAYDDFCISLLARQLGFKEDAVKYHNRSSNWKNIWNPKQKDLYHDETNDLKSTKFVGFMQPRYMNGTWNYQNTRTCTPGHDTHLCYLDTGMSTYEGSPWLYSFFVPQDMQTLIEYMGGKQHFIERLSFYHDSDIVYMGNEQSFLTVYQFHYGGRPGLTSYWVNRYIPGMFNATIGGIPGNDDGAMGAFSTLAMMGFFPVAGQDVYLLSPPFFPEVRLRSRGKHPAIIRKVYHSDEAARNQSIYIQSAKLNGRPYTKSWITHEFFLKGGLLEFTVGPKESDWGTRDEDIPPSWPFK
jgi:putative alpha-1,2-mannosidase